MGDMHEAIFLGKFNAGGGGGGMSDVQDLVLTMDPLTYVITAYLVDGNGTRIGTERTIDIPLESTIVGASYDNTSKDLTFTLTSGATLTVPLDDIIYGLQPLIDAQHKLPASLVDDTQGRFKFTYVGTQAQYVTDAASIPEGTPVILTDDPGIDSTPTQGSDYPVTSGGVYTALEGKQDTLATAQMAAVNSGITAAQLAKLQVINENPENHNGIYRGKDLTNIYTVEQIYERVHDGSFEDLYLGDYFTVNITTDLYTRFTGSAFESGVTYYEMGGTVIARTWTETQDAEPQSGKVYATKQVVNENVDLMIAHFDYYISRGAQSAVSPHHVILIPKNEHLKNLLPMHYTPSVACPYVETDMHNIYLPCFAAAFYTALNAHMLPFSTSLVSTISDDVLSMSGRGLYGAATNFTDVNVYLALPTEQQICGQTLASSSVWEARIDYDKFAIFNFVDVRQGATTSEKIFLRTFAGKEAGNYRYAQLSALGGIGISAQNSSRGVDPYMLFG